MTEIGSFAFYGCSGLASITIPNSVTKISSSMFENCSGLTSVTIGNSVTKIDSWAFYNCSGLKELYLYGITPPNIGNNFTNITKNMYMTVNVYVPQEALEAYQNADVWKNFWNLQGFDPTGIDNVRSDVMNGNSKCYDILGNKFSAPKRGLNIINGKKVIVK